jgi:hypothetical protein
MCTIFIILLVGCNNQNNSSQNENEINLSDIIGVWKFYNPQMAEDDPLTYGIYSYNIYYFYAQGKGKLYTYHSSYVSYEYIYENNYITITFTESSDKVNISEGDSDCFEVFRENGCVYLKQIGNQNYLGDSIYKKNNH